MRSRAPSVFWRHPWKLFGTAAAVAVLALSAPMAVAASHGGNHAPDAVNDTVAVAEDGSQTFDPRANDTDPDGNALTIAQVSNPPHGSAAVHAGTSVTYTPDANYSGPDSFTYTISDGQGGTDTAIVSVTVTAVQDPPVAATDHVHALPDTAVNVDVLANDSDVDGDALDVAGVAGPSHGTAVLQGDDTIIYTPSTGYSGPDSFTYTLSDGHGNFDAGTVTIAVTASNHAPDAVNDSATTTEDSDLTIDVLANDTDPDGDPLAVSSVGSAAHGTATLNDDGTVEYQPDADFSGTDSFDYTATDGFGGSDTATVTVTVSPVADAPQAHDDTATTPINAAITIDVLDNDEDADGDPLQVLSAADPTHGSVVIEPDSRITYTPDPGFTGSDSFEYTIGDSQGGTDTATVTVRVGARPEGTVDEARAICEAGDFSHPSLRALCGVLDRVPPQAESDIARVIVEHSEKTAPGWARTHGGDDAPGRGRGRGHDFGRR